MKRILGFLLGDIPEGQREMAEAVGLAVTGTIFGALLLITIKIFS